MSKDQIKWGILSTAEIGIEKVIPAIINSPSCEVVAIASRNAERAKTVADHLGIPKSYSSYEQLLADPEIDAIYNPLPNDMHVDWTLAAAQAGKHVLCEKPIGMDVLDAQRLLAAPDHIQISEAFMVRYHPQWLRVRELVDSGDLGEVRSIQATFSYYNDDAHNIRNMPKHGGGGMMDIGCYPITAGRFFFDAEPTRVSAMLDIDPTFQTDRMASVLVDFGFGRHLSFCVSTQLVPYQTLNVFGTKGRVQILIPYNAPANQETQIIVDLHGELDGSSERKETLPACDQYSEQAEAFALAILQGKPLRYDVKDALGTMRVLDAVAQSARENQWISVGR